MQRRKFLGIVTLGVGTTTLPMWLSSAFNLRTQSDCGDGDGDGDDILHDPSELPTEFTDPDACMAGATPLGKPRLVIVIPVDQAQQSPRGHAFGELLNHGSDAQLAPLAAFDVVCRKLADLDLVAGDREPLIVIQEPGQAPHMLDTQLPWTDEDPFLDLHINARIAALADLVGRHVDGERLTAQACHERASLPPADLARLRQPPHTVGELQPHDVDRAPATALLAARGPDPDVNHHLTALLAASVRARLCAHPIDGAPWARTTGCGVEVEGEPDSRGGIMCGMGHIPERSQRFLKFYTSRF